MALSAPAYLATRNKDAFHYIDLVVANGVTVYPHALVGVVAATGVLTPCAASTTMRFGGLALGNGGDMQTVVGDGVKKCRIVTRGCEVLITCNANIDATKIMTICYTVDDASVTTTQSGGGPSPGLVVESETSTSCWVSLGSGAAALGT